MATRYIIMTPATTVSSSSTTAGADLVSGEQVYVEYDNAVSVQKVLTCLERIKLRIIKAYNAASLD